MDKGRWFVDVDGPINATNPGFRVWQRHWLEDTVYDGVATVIRYNPGLINAIRNIAKGGLIDVVWCTTWIPAARQLEKVLYLPQLECAFDDCTRFNAWTKKIRAVEKFDQTTDQLWAWTDDEAPDSGPVYEALMDSGRGLIIKADHYTGLTPAEVQSIREHFGLVPSNR